MSTNRVVLIGRLTRDPEMRQTSGGKSVAEFSIAVNKRFKREGERDASFFRVIAWAQTAEYVCKYITKGQMIAVDGRLEQREYTKDGQRREVVAVVADNVQSLTPGQQSAQSQSLGNVESYDPFAEDD